MSGYSLSDEQMTAISAPLSANAAAAASASANPSLPITSKPPASKKFFDHVARAV